MGHINNTNESKGVKDLLKQDSNVSMATAGVAAGVAVGVAALLYAASTTGAPSGGGQRRDKDRERARNYV
jgi:hypothetical protein